MHNPTGFQVLSKPGCSGSVLAGMLGQTWPKALTQSKTQPLKMLGKLLGHKGPGAMLLQSRTSLLTQLVLMSHLKEQVRKRFSFIRPSNVPHFHHGADNGLWLLLSNSLGQAMIPWGMLARWNVLPLGPGNMVKVTV